MYNFFQIFERTNLNIFLLYLSFVYAKMILIIRKNQLYLFICTINIHDNFQK